MLRQHRGLQIGSVVEAATYQMLGDLRLGRASGAWHC